MDTSTSQKVDPAAVEQPVGRLAPSPTGMLHLGHARSLLLAWWHVRSRNGRVVLRIEDLDTARVRESYTQALLRDMEWLGLDWDEGPHFQSAHTERFHAAAQQLLQRGLAYPCICTRKEIFRSAPHRSDGETPYAGTCSGKFSSLEQALEQTGRRAGLRFQVPAGEIQLEDGFAGSFHSNPADEVGDFTILRRDAAIAYQLSVVVDDAAQGIHEILRGEDLLSSAARQWLLQNALGLPHPTWYHVPLVVDAEGRRLAKRDCDISLAEMRAAGIEPQQLVSWIARHSGIPKAKGQSAAELTPEFDLKRVPRTPLVLDPGSQLDLIQRDN